MHIRSSGSPGPDTADLLIVMTTGCEPAAARARVGPGWDLWPRIEVNLAPADDATAWQRANRQVARRLAEARVPTGCRLHLWFAGPPEAAVDLGARLAGRPLRAAPDDAGQPAPPAAPAGDLHVTDVIAALHLGHALGPADGRLAIGPSGVPLRLGDPPRPAAAPSDPWRARLADADARAGQADLTAALDLLRDLDQTATGARAAQVARRFAQWGALGEAEDTIERALPGAPDDPALLDAGANIAQRLGRVGQFLDRLRLAARHAADPGQHARAADQLLRANDHEAAAVEVEAGLRLDPAHPALLGMSADLAVDLRSPDARARVALADRGDPATLDRLVRLGALDEAAARTLPGADGPAWSARLASWRADEPAAVDHARVALASQPDHPAAHVVLAWASLRAGDPRQAEQHLGAAERGLRGSTLVGPDEVLSWRAAALRAQGQQKRAAETAVASILAATRTNLSATLERVLAITRPDADDPLDPIAWLILSQRVAPVIPDLPLDGHIASIRRAFQAALDRFAGNRSTSPTWVDAHGQLHRLFAPDHPRHRGRVLQMLIRHRPLSYILPRFDALDAELPREPVTRTYRGELLLWLGEYDAAAAAFEAALALSELTTWAWIGLGAAHALRGQVDQAMATWARGVEAVDFEGPTLFAYRGEQLRRAGEHTTARLEVDLGLLASRRRVSSWVLRALLAHDEGDGRPAQVVADAVRAQLPGLWLDATRACARPWDTPDPAPVLEAALRLMRGNRSSSAPMWLLPGRAHSSGSFNPPCAPAELFPSVTQAPGRNTERHRGRVART